MLFVLVVDPVLVLCSCVVTAPNPLYSAGPAPQEEPLLTDALADETPLRTEEPSAFFEDFQERRAQAIAAKAREIEKVTHTHTHTHTHRHTHTHTHTHTLYHLFISHVILDKQCHSQQTHGTSSLSFLLSVSVSLYLNLSFLLSTLSLSLSLLPL